MMQITKTTPISWKNADTDLTKILQNTQGNILKGHGRHFITNLFFNFSGPVETRRLLRLLANYHLTNAHRQLLDAEAFKNKNDGGGAFCHFALSHSGYVTLQIPAADIPSDPVFQKGMRHGNSTAALGDDLATWQPEFTSDIDAVLLCAHDSEAETAALTRQMREIIESAGGKIVFSQQGKGLFNADRQGIEHFGYVDGRSQPLMLVEDIDEERDKAGIARWDPTFGPAIALVPDPGAKVIDENLPINSASPGIQDPHAFGSYFIFRKLEQNVRRFKRRELDIAINILGLPPEKRELAGAMIVGRFEDGTPVTM